LKNEAIRPKKVKNFVKELDFIGYDCTNVKNRVVKWKTISITYCSMIYTGRMKELVEMFLAKKPMSEEIKTEFKCLVATNPHLTGLSQSIVTNFRRSSLANVYVRTTAK